MSTDLEALERLLDERLPRRGSGVGGFLINLFTIIVIGTAALLLLRNLGLSLPNFGASTPASAPTLAPAQIRQYQQAAPMTAVEDNINAQLSAPPVATPVPLVAFPSAGGEEVAPAPVQQAAPAINLPIDMLYPTFTPVPSLLTQEQLDAAAASEEQNYLNSINSTLTSAQEAVKEGEAEWLIRDMLDGK